MKPTAYIETTVISYLAALPIEAICRSAGFDPPIICTPIELVREDV